MSSATGFQGSGSCSGALRAEALHRERKTYGIGPDGKEEACSASNDVVRLRSAPSRQEEQRVNVMLTCGTCPNSSLTDCIQQVCKCRACHFFVCTPGPQIFEAFRESGKCSCQGAAAGDL